MNSSEEFMYIIFKIDLEKIKLENIFKFWHPTHLNLSFKLSTHVSICIVKVVNVRKIWNLQIKVIIIKI